MRCIKFLCEMSILFYVIVIAVLIAGYDGLGTNPRQSGRIVARQSLKAPRKEGPALERAGGERMRDAESGR
jgi:hypothetical protein